MDIVRSLFTTILGNLVGKPLIVFIFVLVVVGAYYYYFSKSAPKGIVEALSSQPELILFYSETCGHCKNLMPHWQKLKAEYSGPVKLSEVNVVQQEAVANQNGIVGVPDLRYYSGGFVSGSKDFEVCGARSFNELASFLQSKK